MNWGGAVVDSVSLRERTWLHRYHSFAVTPPAHVHSVIFLGFTAFERNALAAYNRLSASDTEPPMRVVDDLASADFVIVDGDDSPSVDRVIEAGRGGDAIYVGAHAPDGALSWMMRPMDPLQIYRELRAAAATRERAKTKSQAASTPRPDAKQSTTQPGALGSTRERTITVTDPNARQRSGDAQPAVLALLVDDSDIALRFMQRLLHNIGVRAESATVSRRALELAQSIGPDVVFLDVELGPASELDGFELCQRFKRMVSAKGQPIKVVMVTAHDTPSDRVKGTFAGCDAYLPKPTDENALRRTLVDLGLMQRDLLPRRKHRTDFSTSRTGLAED
jgi:two-component system, cell cycle response regulator